MIIDVSHYQGNIQWNLVAPYIQGAYVKITEGTGYVDAPWRNYHDAARSNGIPVGAYHFADLGDPIAEADHFADQYLGAAWQLRPVLDIETNGATAGWIRQFRNQFRIRTGRAPFRVYSSLSLLTGVLDPAGWIDKDSDIWVAAYRLALGWNHPQLVLWQSTSAASVPGIVGNVDADQYYNGWYPALDSPAPVTKRQNEDPMIPFPYDGCPKDGAGNLIEREHTFVVPVGSASALSDHAGISFKCTNAPAAKVRFMAIASGQPNPYVITKDFLNVRADADRVGIDAGNLDLSGATKNVDQFTVFVTCGSPYSICLEQKAK